MESTRPTGSLACPLCPQACDRNRQGKLRADRATQVIFICPSWGVSSLTWAPLRRGFLLPGSGAVAFPDPAAPRFAVSGGLPVRERAPLDRVAIAPICALSIPSASRAVPGLLVSQEHLPERGDRRYAAENHNCDSGAEAPRRSLRLRFRAATRAAASSCDPPHRMTNAPSGSRMGPHSPGEAGAAHRTNGKPQWLIVA